MRKFLIISIFGLTFISVKAQDSKASDFKAVFYNLENLFDTYDDTTIWDEQFLPEGDKHWTKWKYDTKLKNLSKDQDFVEQDIENRKKNIIDSFLTYLENNDLIN